MSPEDDPATNSRGDLSILVAHLELARLARSAGRRLTLAPGPLIPAAAGSVQPQPHAVGLLVVGPVVAVAERDHRAGPGQHRHAVELVLLASPRPAR